MDAPAPTLPLAALLVTLLTVAPRPALGDDGATVQLKVPLGAFADDLPTLVDPTAHYTLYLPPSYTGEREHPVLLIFDPRGRARMAAELFREGADRFGWILVSSNDTRSDESMAPNEKAIQALWPEIRRFSIDPERIYTTGFSGGSIFAWIVAQSSQQVAGVIGVGGRLPAGISSEAPFAHWGTAGSWDFNYDEMNKIDRLLEDQGASHWLEIFPGPHRWMPPELATMAMGWMELEAMKSGLRERDEGLVEMLWTEWLPDLTKDPENALDRLHRLEQLERSFADLRETGSLRPLIQELRDDREVKRLRKERRKWDAKVDRYAREKVPLLTRAHAVTGHATLDTPRAFRSSPETRNEDPSRPIGGGRDREGAATGSIRSLEVLTTDELRRGIELDPLLERAQGDDWPAVAARRMLGHLQAQAGFYLPREWLAQGDYRGARTVLEIALEIRPTSPRLLFDLARCAARLGDETRALASVEAAIENGWRDGEALAGADFESLRASSEYRRLLQALSPPEAEEHPAETTSGR